MLPTFVFITVPGSDANLMLQTQIPFLIGRVWKGTIEDDQERPTAKCPGYNVHILFHGFLGAKPTELSEESRRKVQSILTEMAYFYYEERILPNASRHKRYLD